MLPCAAMMRAPRPRLAPMNSPTTAPTSASTTAMRRPASTDGRPVGSFSRHSVCDRVAPSMRNSSMRSGGTWARPVSVFSSSGKKQISAVMTTVEVRPKPNQTMNSGISASLGTTWLTTT
jgi:hypothetical protein